MPFTVSDEEDEFLSSDDEFESMERSRSSAVHGEDPKHEGNTSYDSRDSTTSQVHKHRPDNFFLVISMPLLHVISYKVSLSPICHHFQKCSQVIMIFLISVNMIDLHIAGRFPCSSEQEPSGQCSRWGETVDHGPAGLWTPHTTGWGAGTNSQTPSVQGRG